MSNFDSMRDWSEPASPPAPEDESVAAKLLRETEVIGRGVGRALAESVNSETAVKLAVSGTIGVALGYAQMRARPLRIAAAAAGTAFGIEFLSGAASPTRWRRVSEALTDTWRSPVNLRQNVETIKDNLGRFVVDTGLMFSGGMAGGIAGQRLARRWHPDLWSGKLTAGTSTPLETASRKLAEPATPDAPIKAAENPEWLLRKKVTTTLEELVQLGKRPEFQAPANLELGGMSSPVNYLSRERHLWQVAETMMRNESYGYRLNGDQVKLLSTRLRGGELHLRVAALDGQERLYPGFIESANSLLAKRGLLDPLY